MDWSGTALRSDCRTYGRGGTSSGKPGSFWQSRRIAVSVQLSSGRNFSVAADRFFGSGVSVFILFPYKLLDSVCGDELADAASEEGNQDREGDAVFPWKKHLS